MENTVILTHFKGATFSDLLEAAVQACGGWPADSSGGDLISASFANDGSVTVHYIVYTED